MIKVHNLPHNYTDYKYLTARAVDGELWFYGGWFNSAEKAAREAREISGVVLLSDDVETA